MVDIESLRTLCLSLPRATEDFPFDETTLVFRVEGKIFACIDLQEPDTFVLKCNPIRAVELCESTSGIEPARRYWNKKYWIQVTPAGGVDEKMVHVLVYHAYAEVVSKLPVRIRTSLQTELETWAG